MTQNQKIVMIIPKRLFTTESWRFSMRDLKERQVRFTEDTQMTGWKTLLSVSCIKGKDKVDLKIRPTLFCYRNRSKNGRSYFQNES